MATRRARKSDGPPLHIEFAQAFVGAVADCEAFEDTERARWLQAGVRAVATAAQWLAWGWLALLLFAVVGARIVSDPAALAAAALDERDALFAVLSLALAGPVVLVLAGWLSLFAFRILADLLARRLPHAFKSLAAPALVLFGLAVAWSWRGDLHAGLWRLYAELMRILELAGKYTPVG